MFISFSNVWKTLKYTFFPKAPRKINKTSVAKSVDYYYRSDLLQ